MDRNYEQEYKKAFEAAKGLHDAGNALTKKQMEIVFPKLAESEDERIRKILINIVKGACCKYGIKYKGDEITEEKLLAYLEKQKEQKPTEWSEEDEDMLNSCISSIEEAKENRYAYKETDGDTSYDHEIAWLKLLRNRVGKEFLQPHWRPTEEQMEAFKGYIEDSQARAEAAVGGWNNFDVMIRLYEQLKAIKENKK